MSVVMVCRNAATTIDGAIGSFLAQTHSDKELLIIDGASTDATQQLVRAHVSDQVRLISEPDGGLYHAMNKGLGLFGGDVVGFLNADDRFSGPHALEAIASALHEADIVFGDLDFVARDSADRVVRRWRSAPFRPGAFRRGWMPAHPTFYCRRAVIERVGSFDCRYRIAADYDFMLRCLELTDFRCKAIADVLVLMRAGGKSGSGLAAVLQHNLEALASRQRRLGAGLVDLAFFAKPLSKVPQLVRHG